MKIFVMIGRMLVVMSILIICRAWLYWEYVEVHGHGVIGYFVLPTIAVLLLYFIRTLKVAQKKRTIATHGLYAIVAHPAYVMYVIIDIPLWFLMPFSLFLVVTGVLLYVVLLTTAYTEEVALIRWFGDYARGYYSKTPSIHFFLWKTGLCKR